MYFSKKDFLSLVKETYPEIKEQSITRFDDGWDHIIYVINDKKAFRFPRNQEYAKSLKREVSFLRLFSPQSPVRVPQLSLNKSSDGLVYATYDFIPGKPFDREYAQTLRLGQLKNIAGQIGTFLSVLHSFSLEKAKQLGFIEQDPTTKWRHSLKEIRNDVYPYVSESEQAWIEALFSDFIKLIDSKPYKSKVIHADIMPEHIIIDPKTSVLTGIIDFGDVGIGDPAFDFTFLHKYGRDFINNVYTHYKLDIDNYFEKRRRFYEDRLLVTDFRYSLKRKNNKQTKMYKKRLLDRIYKNNVS